MSVRGAGICLFNYRSVLLVHQRASNLWGFPKGSLHQSESFEQCWRRELFEETGLVKLPRFNLSYTTVSHEYTVLIAQFLSPLLPEVRANDEEIVEAKWVSLKEVFNLNLNALTRRVLFSYPFYSRYLRPKLDQETLQRLDGVQNESEDAKPEKNTPPGFSFFTVPCETFLLCLPSPERQLSFHRVSTS